MQMQEVLHVSSVPMQSITWSIPDIGSHIVPTSREIRSAPTEGSLKNMLARVLTEDEVAVAGCGTAVAYITDAATDALSSLGVSMAIYT